MSIYHGEPRLILTDDGVTMKWVGGQPIMDAGLENMALISLFTESWAGNDLFDNQDQKIGSDFVPQTRKPITLQSLNDIRDSAEKALKNPVFGKITIIVENPKSYRLKVTITLEPPGQDIKILVLSKNGLNWISQAFDPAYRRI